MESASAQSAAAKPQSLTPSPPMSQPGVNQSPKPMTLAEVAAAIAALPGKKDALRVAFDRLAACSPYPLPFAWDDLDAHISSIQSSISLRYRQLQVLQAARPNPILAPVPTGDDEETGEEEEEEEEEEVEEEEEEEEEEVEEEEEEEVVEEVVVEEEEEYEEEEVEVEEEEEEVEEVEEEEEYEEVEVEVEVEEEVEEVEEEEEQVEEVGVEEEEVEEVEEEDVDANNVVNKEHKADEEMLEAEEEKVKEHEELVASDEADDKENKVEKGEEEKEESDGEMEETGEANKVLLKGVDKHLVKACATMNTASLVHILFNNNKIARQEYSVAIRHAKDAAAFILDVIRRFLPNKKTKINRDWEKLVTLIRSVPLVESELSVHTTQQAKQLAKDWKKMIDKGDICGDLGFLSSWAFLYFLISYKIVSEFDVNEIIRLFGTVPRKYQRKSCIGLCNGLGLVSRISDLMDYLIGNGQQLSAIQMTQVLKLVDKYPPISLLEGYVKKAKRTALELFSKNVSDKSLNLARSKEIDNLWIAHTMVKQQHADSSKSSAILEEINNLLAEYAKSRSSIDVSATPNKNSCQQQNNQPQKEEEKFKKRKKEQQQHEEQDRHVQGKQRKLEGNQEQPQEKRQQLPQYKPQESKDQQLHENKGQQHHNEQVKKQKQQHLNQPRPCSTKLATPVSPYPRFLPPAVPSVAHISPIWHQPFAVMPGASQPHFPWIQSGPLAANVVPPQYNPFQQNYLYHHSSFYYPR